MPQSSHAHPEVHIAAELIQLLFFSCVFTHIGTSLTNAFVTLGFLGDPDKKLRLDRALWVICAVIWAAAVLVTGRTYIMMAAMP